MFVLSFSTDFDSFLFGAYLGHNRIVHHENECTNCLCEILGFTLWEMTASPFSALAKEIFDNLACKIHHLHIQTYLHSLHSFSFSLFLLSPMASELSQSPWYTHRQPRPHNPPTGNVKRLKMSLVTLKRAFQGDRKYPKRAQSDQCMLSLFVMTMWKEKLHLAASSVIL